MADFDIESETAILNELERAAGGREEQRQRNAEHGPAADDQQQALFFDHERHADGDRSEAFDQQARRSTASGAVDAGEGFFAESSPPDFAVALCTELHF